MRASARKDDARRVGHRRYRFDFDRKPTASVERPERVIASGYRESTGTTYVLRIPMKIAAHPTGRRGLNFRLIATANICAQRMNAELQAGRSVEWAIGFRQFAGGWVAAELKKASNGTINVDARTASAYMQEIVSWGSLEIVGKAHGRLREVTRRGKTDFAWTRGANIYALPQIARKIRIDKFTRHLLSTATTSSSLSPFSVSSLYTETRRRRRMERALEWAIQNAYPGCRNMIGYRLACILKKAGVDEWQAREPLLEYRDHVDDRGYTRADALASLRSAYRNPRVYVEGE